MAFRQEDIKGFHRLSPKKRLEKIQKIYAFNDSEIELLGSASQISSHVFENLIENYIGFFPIPMGVATGFHIDGKNILIPMAVEETSVIAAASITAKWVARNGFIHTHSKGQVVIGQIQLPFVQNYLKTKEILEKQCPLLIQLGNACIPSMVERGGGIRNIFVREISENTLQNKSHSQSRMLVLHIVCDPCDAMGANLINQICEALKPYIEESTGERVGLCILSNLGDSQLVTATVTIENINPILGYKIEEATVFAKADIYRATTHNKGVLNGIDAVLIATGNDWRAVEAGIHAYAARSGCYQPITDWKMHGTNLVGKIEVPLTVGIVGGMTSIHPIARIALKMLGVSRASELARICAAVGLIQNLGALKALTTSGIVKGHMQLHASNLAIAAGAEVHEIASVRAHLMSIIKHKEIVHLKHAKEILADVRNGRRLP